MSEGSGIIAAHLYDFLTRIYPAFGGGKNYIQTPAFVKRWFGSQQPRQIHRGYGVAYHAGDRAYQGLSNSSWYSSLGGSWRGRGSGRRLGGD
jgi:Derlin-2/3